jgi:nucleoside-diphosphate kinase
MEKTLGIIKPDAVSKNLVGPILARASEAGLRIVAIKMLSLSKSAAEGFYHVHRERPFFNDLTTFMSEGPIVVVLFEGDGAIAKWRRTMGATDPARADAGTLRNLYGENVERNAVHGSDAVETASFEIGYFFSSLEQFSQLERTNR